MANINKIAGIPGYESQTFDIEALHFNGGENLDTPAQWKAYIDSMGDLGFNIYTDLIGSTLPTANATNWTKYHKGIVLCNNGETPETGSYVEWVIVRSGTSSSYTYAWEKIGTTSADLGDYSKRGHTHTITVDVSKKLGATATGTAVASDGTANAITAAIKSASLDVSDTTATGDGRQAVIADVSHTAASLTGTKTFVTSYPGASSKMVTTTITPYTTTDKTVATRASSQTTVGNANVGTAVSVPNVTSAGTNPTWTNTVSAAGVWTISWSAGSNTTLGTAISITPATESTTKIYGCGDTTTVKSVTAGTAVTVATGSLSADGTGATVMTGLGTASTGTVGISGGSISKTTKYIKVATAAADATATVLTGVKVTSQPSITITENTTNTGPVNEHVTTTTSADVDPS